MKKKTVELHPVIYLLSVYLALLQWHRVISNTDWTGSDCWLKCICLWKKKWLLKGDGFHKWDGVPEVDELLNNTPHHHLVDKACTLLPWVSNTSSSLSLPVFKEMNKHWDTPAQLLLYFRNVTNHFLTTIIYLDSFLWTRCPSFCEHEPCWR